MPVSRRPAISLALLALSMVLCPSYLVLTFVANDAPGDAEQVFESAAYASFLVFPLIGALITTHRPQNTEGLVFSVAGLAWLLEGTAFQYATYGLVTEPGSLPLPEIAAWLSNWLWVVEIGPLTTFALLLFPTGRVPGPRWVLVARVAAFGIIAASLSSAFNSDELEGFDPDIVQNPLALEALEPLAIAVGVLGVVAIAISSVASAASVILRLQRSEGIERQQMKWFAYAAGLAAIGVTITIVGYLISSETGEKAVYALLTLFALPIAAGVAILRYRLYDIDLIINRTIVYGALTAILAGVYSASLTLFKFLFESASGSGSQTTTVLTTLVLAAMFTPVKSRLQAMVDRYVGRPADPARELARFTDELRIVSRALDPVSTMRDFAIRAMQVTSGSEAKAYLLRNGRPEMVFSQGAGSDLSWQRLPITVDGEDLGWIDLGHSASSAGRVTLDAEIVQKAVAAVGEALRLSVRAAPPVPEVGVVAAPPA